jgi:hypothetical protein
MRRRYTWIATGLGFILTCAAAHASVTLSVVAYPGEAAPGTNNGTFSSLLGDPSIDINGQVSFEAYTGNSAMLDDTGIWTGTAGNLTPVVYSGLVAPGNNGDSYQGTNQSAIDVEQQGPLAFVAWLNTPGGGTLSGTWIDENGTAVQVVNPNIPVPGYPSSTFGAPSIWVNPQGQYAFAGYLNIDTGPDGGIWANLNGTLQLSMYSGLQAAGLQSGTTWATGGSAPAIVPGGQVVFSSSLSNGESGLFSSNGATTTAIALSGQPVPGDPGESFGTLVIGQPLPSSNGNVAFVDPNNVWLYTSSGYQRVASVGSTVIGGGTLSAVSGAHALNNGNVIFAGSQTNGTSGVYESESDGIHVIARTGMQAPGQATGTTFYSIFDLEVNDVGQVAFEADIKSASAAITYNYIYATDPNGDLDFIAGRGSPVPISNGLYTSTTGASLFGYGPPPLTQFNDSGNLVFTMGLLDKYGNTDDVFVEAQGLPEPTRCIVFLMPICFLLFHRRHRKIAAAFR